MRVLAHGARFLVHSNSDRKHLQLYFPEADVVVHAHPIFAQFPTPTNRHPRRAKLELLFYGFVRPYKGLNVLLDAMAALKGDDAFLTVAGEFWYGEEEARSRVMRLGIDAQVELRTYYQSDRETADLFDRADVVVLPYLSATTTGVVPLAYQYGKPVIVTQVGDLPELVEHRVTGWIVAPGSSSALADTIRSISSEKAKSMVHAIQLHKELLTWESMVDCILAR